MKVRFLRDWKRCRAGRVYSWPSRGAARLLVRRGIVEEVAAKVEDPQPNEKRRRRARKVRA